jgi:Tol biopolymer transport system component
VFPAGSSKPTASNLNMVAGQTVPNMVIVPVGANGQVSLYNLAGNTHLIVDVLAWFPSATASITGVNPARLLETRSFLSTVDNKFNATGAFGPGGTQSVTVVGRGGVPETGVAAVALNVTATGGTNGSFLTVWPKGATKPNASNVNFTAGQTVPNMVVVPIGADGQVSIFNFAGNTDVIVDVLAWFPDNGNTTPPSTTSTTVPSVTAPISRISTFTGGGQGTVTRSPSESPTFSFPAPDIDGESNPLFYYSEGPAISTNGQYVAFATFLRLDAQDTDDVSDVYRKNLATGEVELVSIPTGAPNGASPTTLGGTASATEPAISADGSIVVFQSSQQGLTAGTDNNGGAYDVFARRMVAGNTGTTVRLTNGNAASTYPDISDNGQFVVFQSNASDIVTGDTNSAQDGFVMEINPANLAVVTAPTRISVTATGAQATCAANCNSGRGFIGSFDTRISNNGNVIVFSSDADNLVTGDTNGERDVFWVQRGNAASLQRISVTSSETQVFGGTADDPEPSADGSFVSFHSRGNNLATGDNENGFEVYLRDVTNGNTTVLPGGNGAGNHPMISGDGNYVSFSSTSASVVSGDDNGVSDVFLYSRITQTVTRISVSAQGALGGTDRSLESSISGDGDRIAFISLAPNLVTGDSNGAADIFLYDRP